MDLFDQYKKMKIDGHLIGLDDHPITIPYFCYPINAKVIGFEGCILYCFLCEYEEMVFAVNPQSCVDKYVYPLAANFHDFLRLLITCGSVNPIEQIVWMSKERFTQYVNEEMKQASTLQKELLLNLQKEFQLTLMDHPYEYVKSIQEDFDDHKIQFSAEYYEVLGIESPYQKIDEKHCFEFEPVEIVLTNQK